MTINKETEYFNYDGNGYDFEHGTGSTRTGFNMQLNHISISNIVKDVDCLSEPACWEKNVEMYEDPQVYLQWNFMYFLTNKYFFIAAKRHKCLTLSCFLSALCACIAGS